MEYLKFILYGLIQGSTEFIPVSSTAHLKIISLLFGIDDPGSSLSAIIQLGSVFAIFWYFRNDLFRFNKKITKKIYKSVLYKKLLESILVGTIPFLFFGGIIKIYVPNFFYNNLRSNFLIAIVSILMAFFMFYAEISKNRLINLKNHNYLHSFLIGLPSICYYTWCIKIRDYYFYRSFNWLGKKRCCKIFFSSRDTCYLISCIC